MDLACEQAGFTTRAVVEINANARETMAHNAPVFMPHLNCDEDEGALFADITLTPPELLLERAGLRRKEATLLHGGPPCVAFSKTGYWLPYKREDRDEKATLVDWYAGMVAETKPLAVLMENVYGLVYKRSRHHLHRFLAEMDEAGYEMRYSVLLAADYGVPQIRQRLFCVGIRRDLFSSEPAWWQFPWPEQSHAGPHETRKLWRTELRPIGRPVRRSRTCEMGTTLQSPRRSCAGPTQTSCARFRLVTITSSGPPSAGTLLRAGSGGLATGRSSSRPRRARLHRRSRGNPGRGWDRSTGTAGASAPRS